MNAYQTLGVRQGASAEEIKKAYHALAQKHHPDKGGSVEKMKEINRAYNEIKDGKSGYSRSTYTSSRGYSSPTEAINHIKLAKIIFDLRILHNESPELNIRELLKREFNL